ncbi:hypothetical protein EJB05_44970, partial [Eragrostis curvula]
MDFARTQILGDGLVTFHGIPFSLYLSVTKACVCARRWQFKHLIWKLLKANVVKALYKDMSDSVTVRDGSAAGQWCGGSIWIWTKVWISSFVLNFRTH